MSCKRSGIPHDTAQFLLDHLPTDAIKGVADDLDVAVQWPLNLSLVDGVEVNIVEAARTKAAEGFDLA